MRTSALSLLSVSFFPPSKQMNPVKLLYENFSFLLQTNKILLFNNTLDMAF